MLTPCTGGCGIIILTRAYWPNSNWRIGSALTTQRSPLLLQLSQRNAPPSCFSSHNAPPSCAHSHSTRQQHNHL